MGVDRFTTAGDKLSIFEVEGVKIGLLICYDGTFPEPARVLALKGINILILPTNWPMHSENVADHVIVTRAIESKIYVLSVNRIGKEGDFEFCGKSKFCSPDGNILDQAASNEFKMISAEVDVDLSRNKKSVRIAGVYELDNVNGRRAELYGGLQKIRNSDEIDIVLTL